MPPTCSPGPARRIPGARAMPGRPPTLAGMARLHVVTGKGGTGKTTVAAAMALALADRGPAGAAGGGRGTAGPGPAVRRTAAAVRRAEDRRRPGGGEVYALAVDAEAALLEYLDMFYHLGRAGKALDKVGAVDFATTIAPGLRDVLLTGKVYEATRAQVPRAARVRRGGAGCTADRTDQPVPERQPRGRRPGQDRPDPQPGGLDHGDATVRHHRRTPGHAARGDAGPGNAGRRRAPRGAGSADRLGRGEHGPAQSPRRRGPHAGGQGETARWPSWRRA